MLTPFDIFAANSLINGAGSYEEALQIQKKQFSELRDKKLLKYVKKAEASYDAHKKVRRDR